MPFSTRQQKLDKLCWGYKILRPRLTKYCQGRVPGGVDAYGLKFTHSDVVVVYLQVFDNDVLLKE